MTVFFNDSADTDSRTALPAGTGTSTEREFTDQAHDGFVSLWAYNVTGAALSGVTVILQRKVLDNDPNSWVDIVTLGDSESLGGAGGLSSAALVPNGTYRVKVTGNDSASLIIGLEGS